MQTNHGSKSTGQQTALQGTVGIREAVAVQLNQSRAAGSRKKRRRSGLGQKKDAGGNGSGWSADGGAVGWAATVSVAVSGAVGVAGGVGGDASWSAVAVLGLGRVTTGPVPSRPYFLRKLCKAMRETDTPQLSRRSRADPSEWHRGGGGGSWPRDRRSVATVCRGSVHASDDGRPGPPPWRRTLAGRKQQRG